MVFWSKIHLNILCVGVCVSLKWPKIPFSFRIKGKISSKIKDILLWIFTCYTFKIWRHYFHSDSVWNVEYAFWKRTAKTQNSLELLLFLCLLNITIGRSIVQLALQLRVLFFLGIFLLISTFFHSLSTQMNLIQKWDKIFAQNVSSTAQWRARLFISFASTNELKWTYNVCGSQGLLSSFSKLKQIRLILVLNSSVRMEPIDLFIWCVCVICLSY